MNQRKLLLTFAAALGLALPIAAQTILVGPDTFTSGTAESNGYYSYNSNSAGTAWTISSAEELRNTSGGAANTFIYNSFAETTITLGESFTVNASFRNEQSASVSGTLSLYLVDLSSPITANDFGGTDPMTNRTGIGIEKAYTAAALSARRFTGSGLTKVTAETIGTGDFYRTVAGSRFAPAPDLSGGGSLVDISLTYSIDSNGLLMEGTVGGDVLSYRLENVTSFTANALHAQATWVNGTGDRFSRFDNIEVSTIPEPGTAALATGILGFALVLLRRRRRS